MSQFPQVDVKSLKVAELKEELTKRGLDTKGLKKDLADRLQDYQDSHKAESTGPPPSSADDENKVEADGVEDGVGRTMLEGYAEDPNTQKPKSPTPTPEDLVGTEPAALDEEVAQVVAAEESKEMKSPVSSPPSRLSPLPIPVPSENTQSVTVAEEKEEKAVGGVMVEGYPENPKSTHHKTPSSPPKEIMETEPAILDDEVAKIVAEEESKDLKSPTPSPPRRLSPLPKDNGAEDEGHEDMQLDDEEEEQSTNHGESSKKRTRSSSPPTQITKSNKRSKLSLPSPLSHIQEPPTSVLYITNLKRPLLHSTLHPYLNPSKSDLAELPPLKMPFSSDEYQGLWLSGVKSHAYATYPTEEEAINAAEKIENKRWPEDTGDILKIHFIPEDKLLDLVQQEEKAWSNGRQKLTLKVTPPGSENEDQDWVFELVGTGGLGRIPAPPSRAGPSNRDSLSTSHLSGSNTSRPIAVPLTGGDRRGPPGSRAVAVPLTGVNAINPSGRNQEGSHPRGQGMNIGIRGRANPNHHSQISSRPIIPDQPRGGNGYSRDGRRYDKEVMRNGTGEGLRGWSDERDKLKKEKDLLRMRPTRYQPRLFWKKGPGALDGV